MSAYIFPSLETMKRCLSDQELITHSLLDSDIRESIINLAIRRFAENKMYAPGIRLQTQLIVYDIREQFAGRYPDSYWIDLAEIVEAAIKGCFFIKFD